MSDDISVTVSQSTPITVTSTQSNSPESFLNLTDSPSSYSGESEKYIRVTTAEDGIEFSSSTSADVNVKITAADTTTGYLNSKLSAGTGITLNLTNTGGNEVLEVVNSAPIEAISLTAGTGITITGTSPNYTITNSDPDQVVSISGGTNVTVGGTYPTFAITDNSINNSDLTAVAITTNANYNGSDCGGSTGTTGRTLTHTKDLGNQTIIFKNRAILHPTIDYTTSSAIITFNVYVDDGDTITVMA